MRQGSPARPPIRVLYLTHTARLSGAELALAGLLAALDRLRVEPIVMLAEDGPLRERLLLKGIETHVLPLSDRIRQVRKDSLGIVGLLRQLRSLGALSRHAWRVGRFARRARVDLIYGNSLKAHLYGAAAARLSGIPLVWHVHDRIDERYLPRSSVWLLRVLARHVPQAVIANSESTLATLRLPQATRTAIVPSGLTPEHIARCWGPPAHNNPPRIGIVGRLTAWKGQDVFLEAAARLLQRGVSAHFLIAGAALFGEEAFETRLRGRVTALGIAPHVEFLGFRDVPPLLRTLDILVHASTIPEPFGQVITEGLAAELPVIATNGGGAREIIEDGRTGVLVPMGDADALAEALVELLAQPERARRLAAAGRAHVLAHFTVDRFARRSEAFYEELLRPST